MVNSAAFVPEIIEAGVGETVLLVHGSLSDRRIWDHQQPALADHFRVLSYSRRYHWPNEKIAEGADYSMDEQVDDLLGLITRLDCDSVHLVGHSYGGFLALLAAIRRPTLIKTLVLIEPPVVPLVLSEPPRTKEIVRLFRTNARLAVALIKFGASGVGPAIKAARRNDLDAAAGHFGRAVLGKAKFDSLSQYRLEQIAANNIRAEYISNFSALTPAEVRTVTARTLLVTGENSPTMFRLLTEHLAGLLTNVSRAQIPAASHIVHEDNPIAFTQAVLGFLAVRD